MDLIAYCGRNIEPQLCVVPLVCDMARRRMLDPDFWADEEVSSMSAHARLLFMGLWGICDDNYATFPDRPEWIKVQVFPYETVDVRSLLAEIEKIGKIERFLFDNKHYWYIKNFHKHQVINRPSRPKYPPYKVKLGGISEDSMSTHHEMKRKEDKRKEGLSNESKKIQDEIREKFSVKRIPRG